MSTAIDAINEKVKKESAFIQPLVQEIEKVIVGQKYLIERLLVGILANGHILIEGVPGLAKTLSVRVLAQAIKTKFQRLQFTPDLLPADLIGTLIYNQKDGEFTVKKGDCVAFDCNLEHAFINKSPRKSQCLIIQSNT